MKILFIVIVVLSFLTQTHTIYSCLVGNKAPDFTAQAVTKSTEYTVHLKDLQGPIVLLFYPKDFTFVCPTELRAFQGRIKDLHKRKVTIVGISTDSIKTHKKWLATPIKKGGVSDVSFPLISDPEGEIARAYGVLNPKTNVAFRGIFIIDKNHVIQSITINNNPLGRSVDETIRIIDAMKETEKHGTVCPANWHKGEKTMNPTQAGLKEYLKETEE